MRIPKVVSLLALVLALSGLFSVVAEAPANADFAAAEKAAKEAEAAVAPARTAADHAAAEQRTAEQAAVAGRQQAMQARRKADDLVASLQTPAETNLATAMKAVADATNAKAVKDKALVDVKAAALRLQEGYDTAEKAAKEAEAKAKQVFRGRQQAGCRKEAGHRRRGRQAQSGR